LPAPRRSDFRSISYGQAEKIKIGHLTPLTGFLGALGTYAQLGMRLAEEEINASGGIMGRQLEVMSEDSVNPATAATKAERMLGQDGALVLMGEANSASALTIMQVVARNKRCSCRPARAPTRCAARTATGIPSTPISPTR
jgi:branched-chain amino acid transport system substrate-binding protein